MTPPSTTAPSTLTTREELKFVRSGTMESAATPDLSRSARQGGAINATDALVRTRARIARIPTNPRTRRLGRHRPQLLKGHHPKVHLAPRVGNPAGAALLSGGNQIFGGQLNRPTHRGVRKKEILRERRSRRTEPLLGRMMDPANLGHPRPLPGVYRLGSSREVCMVAGLTAKKTWERGPAVCTSSPDLRDRVTLQSN